MLLKKTEQLLSEIREMQKNPSVETKMPRNTFFMKNDNILCCERVCGDSRFPYSNDGYILWAHSTGHIQVKDGLFNVFKPLINSSDPSVEFFAGVDMGNGEFFPVSILGAAKQLFEPFCVERYLVYCLSAAYYIADTDFATFVVRASMSKRNELVFSCGFINKTDKPMKVRFTSYFDAFLNESDADSMWDFENKKASYADDGAFVMTRIGTEKALLVTRTVSGARVSRLGHTTHRSAFLGSNRANVSAAKCLKTGSYAEGTLSEYGDIASEILMLEIDKSARVDYILPLTFSKEERKELLKKEIKPSVIDEEIESYENAEQKRFANLSIKFDGFEDGNYAAGVFNGLTKKIQKQVDNCAMGRYYVGNRLGVRDAMQQLEQALLWDAEQAREKMLRVLSYLDPSGRAPRQIAIPFEQEKTEVVDKMDLRAFIDQGNWIISCFYSYLAWTGDYSILDEELTYYDMPDDGYMSSVRLSKERGSCLEHLIRVADYLEGQLDTEDGTGCLKILFGDWNDALDGLGQTKDEGKKYGTGVSVMASLHFYRNLQEIQEILEKVGGYDDKIKHYAEVGETLKNGLLKHAIVSNAEGKKRIIHGWGDHMSYKIGSFCDSDGVSRIGFAANAFWVSTGLIEETPELKPLIIESIHALDSKFGLKTFDRHFEPDAPGVGRLASILKGTAENECVYVHASMFSILALFGVGDAEYAWEQFVKVLPVTNEQTTRSPFVMSNSYLDNEEYDMKGQSPIDWYTGSGTVYIKNIVRGLLGINADLDGVIIKTAKSIPSKIIQADVKIKGNNVRFEYKKEGGAERKIYIDGELAETGYDELAETLVAVIPNEKLYDGIKITVVD